MQTPTCRAADLCHCGHCQTLNDFMTSDMRSVRLFLIRIFYSASA